jgi:hypothetical protein
MSQKTKLPYPFPLPNRVGQKKTHPLPRHPKPGAQPDVFDIVGSIGVGPYEYKAWGYWYYYVAELLEYGDGSHAIWLHYWSYAAHGSRFGWEYGEAGPCDRPETMSPNEARTRKEKIDPALLKPDGT